MHRPPQLVHALFICDASAFQWVGAHLGEAPWQRRRTRRRNRTACEFRIAKRPNIRFGRLFFLLSQAIRGASCAYAASLPIVAVGKLQFTVRERLTFQRGLDCSSWIVPTFVATVNEVTLTLLWFDLQAIVRVDVPARMIARPRSGKVVVWAWSMDASATPSRISKPSTRVRQVTKVPPGGSGPRGRCGRWWRPRRSPAEATRSRPYRSLRPLGPPRATPPAYRRRSDQSVRLVPFAPTGSNAALSRWRCSSRRHWCRSRGGARRYSRNNRG